MVNEMLNHWNEILTCRNKILSGHHKIVNICLTISFLVTTVAEW